MVYGGEGQKGARADPRSGTERQQAMFTSRRGGGPRWTRYLMVVLAAVAFLAVTLLLVRIATDGSETGEVADPGGLSCASGTPVHQEVAGEGRTPREILQELEPSVAAVVRDEVSTGKWRGLDANDVTVALLQELASAGQYEVATCAG
jgi:hypothetical protein